MKKTMRYLKKYTDRDACSWSDGLLLHQLKRILKDMKKGKLDAGDRAFLRGCNTWRG